MASKKIDQDFVLSDSSLNVYGFRLFTPGYSMEEFLKNPIGYYGHEKDDGVLVRWEDLRIDGDQVLGRPVINLEHPRAARTIAEIEEGFLNAASMGGIVVLAYHLDDNPDLAGNPILVVDQWYNKECSLVDNPGNREAFKTELEDAGGVSLNIQDLVDKKFAITLAPDNIGAVGNGKIDDGFVRLSMTPELIELLSLGDAADEEAILKGIRDLKVNHRIALEQLGDERKMARALEVQSILDKGLSDGRITMAARSELEATYADNPLGLRKLVNALQGYTSLSERLHTVPADLKDLVDKSYDELDKADKLHLLREKAPGLYREKYLSKFGKEPRS